MRVWVGTAAAAVFILAFIESAALQPKTEHGTLPIDPPTPYIRYIPNDTPRGRVLVVHGLDASKEVMQLLSAAMTDAGWEVLSIDLPGHGDSTVGFEATRAERAIRNVVNTMGMPDVAVGHSLGAGLLLDLSQDLRFSRMVLLSPPPTPVEKIGADRVLIVSGGLDVPRINAFAPVLAGLGGGHVELWNLPWAGHSSAIFNPRHIARIVNWMGQSGAPVHSLGRVATIALMFIAGAVFGIAFIRTSPISRENGRASELLVKYVVACGVAMVVLKFIVPLHALRLFAADYLVSFLFLTGVALWTLGGVRDLDPHPAASGGHPLPMGEGRGEGLSRGLLHAIAAAFFVILILGFLAGGHILHMRLTAGRAWRFPIIVVSSFPLLLFDEIAIRRLSPRWKSIRVALVSRVLIGAFILTGILVLNPEDAFLVLIVHLMVLFWIALWFGTELIYRHTQNAFAAALFAALIQGWAFAAWFVTT